MRDTACAPQPPTNRAPNEPARRQGLYVPKKAYFGAKMAVLGPNILTILTKRYGTHISVCSMRLLVRIVLLVGHGTKWIIKANIWPKMTKYAYFGPNLAVFRPNIPIFTRRSKSFGIHINENHFCTLFALFFGRTWDQMGQK